MYIHNAANGTHVILGTGFLKMRKLSTVGFYQMLSAVSWTVTRTVPKVAKTTHDVSLMAGSSDATTYSEIIPTNAKYFRMLLPDVLHSFLGPDSELFECLVDDHPFLCGTIRG